MIGCSVAPSNSVEIAPEINDYWVCSDMDMIFTFKATDVPCILSNRNLEAKTDPKEWYFVLSRTFCSEHHSFRAALTKSTRHENSSAILVSILLLNNVSGRTELQPLPSKRHDTRWHSPGHMNVQDGLHSPTDKLSVAECSISEIPYCDLQPSSTT